MFTYQVLNESIAFMHSCCHHCCHRSLWLHDSIPLRIDICVAHLILLHKLLGYVSYVCCDPCWPHDSRKQSIIALWR